MIPYTQTLVGLSGNQYLAALASDRIVAEIVVEAQFFNLACLKERDGLTWPTYKRPAATEN